MRKILTGEHSSIGLGLAAQGIDRWGKAWVTQRTHSPIKEVDHLFHTDVTKKDPYIYSKYSRTPSIEIINLKPEREKLKERTNKSPVIVNRIVISMKTKRQLLKKLKHQKYTTKQESKGGRSWKTAIRYVSSPSLWINKECGAERAMSTPPALTVANWALCTRSLSSWAVIDIIWKNRREGKTWKNWPYDKGWRFDGAHGPYISSVDIIWVKIILFKIFNC